MKSKIEQLGNLCRRETEFSDPIQGRVYSPDGICPTLNTVAGGLDSENSDPFIRWRIPGKNFNSRLIVHPWYGISRTLLGSGQAGNEPKVLVLYKEMEK